jgi:hypothetical protein
VDGADILGDRSRGIYYNDGMLYIDTCLAFDATPGVSILAHAVDDGQQLVMVTPLTGARFLAWDFHAVFLSRYAPGLY